VLVEKGLSSTEYPRRQLPAPLIEALVEAHRSGVTSFTVAVLDQLAPELELCRRGARNNDAVGTMYMPTIADAIRSLCYIAPPADVRDPVLTMAPDEADHATFPPATIRDQWRECVEKACNGGRWHSWRGVNFGAVYRVDGYQLAAQSPFVIRTASREPYANVWLTVNPAASGVLKHLPAAAPAKLIAYLSRAGHGNGVAIIPAQFESQYTTGAEIVRATGSVDDVAAAVATLWHPDTYVKHPEDALQRGFGVHAPSSALLSLPELPNGWGDERVRQIVDQATMQAALSNDLVGLSVIADGGGEKVLVMTNGISGHDGGF
jgi:L-fucose mutarotase/ribose pyranase (RbsD/FucU family)